VIDDIFSGVRVIELAQYVFVPGAGVLLADKGAEVIHVETVGTGDPYRTLKVGDGREIGDINLAMEQNNRGKKSIALDLKNPAGREAFAALLKTADVFLTSLRPKALDALGLDIESVKAINPKLIYARGNGYGFKGADANRAGFDASAFWARGGVGYAMTPPGQALTPARPAFGDHSGSVGLAYGVAAALFKRAMTGEAVVVDTSLLSTAAWMLSSDITYSQVDNYQVHNTNKFRFPLMSAYNTKDNRQLQLMLLDPQPYWPGLCKMIGREDLIADPRFADNPSRMNNGQALVEAIAAEIIKQDWAHWEPIFNAWDAPWELICSIHDVAKDPQALENGMCFTLDVDGTPIQVVAGPAAFNGEPGPLNPQPSAKLGAHTDELLRSAGYTDAAIADLKAKRVAQ